MSDLRLSDAEWTVMTAVWASAPATTRQVLEAVESETGWAYSTIKTMLDRLVEKGALEGRIEGITTQYRPRITRDEARRTAAESLADRAFDGEIASMVQFLVARERLTPKEKATLRALLDPARRKARRKHGDGGKA